MKQTNFSTKEFNEIVKGAKVELNGTFKSPFVVCNLLNKAAKGDFSKVAGVEDITRENLSKVAGVIKSIHNGRYAFDMCIFEKDYKGRFCTTSKVKETGMPDYYDINGISALVYTDNKGREIIDGVLYTPISLTINGIFGAFAKVAKVDISERERAQKEFLKAAKKAEKIRENRIKDLNNAFAKGVLTEVEYNEKMKALKAA